MITAGEEWAGAIDRRFEEADIILLLLSADFVHSRYCFDVEMKRAPWSATSARRPSSSPSSCGPC
jgi:hypothetical protein